ncbi:MAG: T9SS type A sorting domain-containing protein [Chitinophagales bacterium]
MKNLSFLKSAALLLIFFLLRINMSFAQTWSEANDGNIGSDITGFVSESNQIYASSDASGVFVTDNNSIHWSATNNGLTSTFVNALYSYGGNLYAGTYGNGVYVSHDGGNNWSLADSGFLQLSVYTNTFISLDTFLFVGNDDAGYSSTDSGKHWQVVPWLGLQEVKSFAVDGNVLYAGTEYGMHVSTDSGATWPYANNGFPAEETITHITVSSNRVLCVMYQHGVFSSTDSGANWIASSSGIPSSANILSLFADGSTVYAGTETNGIYRSTDNGATWSNYSFGQSLPKITAFCKSNGIIYAGTDVSGVLKLEDAASAVPTIASTSLHLYPNPAADEIFIQDDLSGIKEIRIVDAIGRCVWHSSENGISSKEISVEHLSPGIYTAIVDGTAMTFEKY